MTKDDIIIVLAILSVLCTSIGWAADVIMKIIGAS